MTELLTTTCKTHKIALLPLGMKSRVAREQLGWDATGCALFSAAEDEYFDISNWKKFFPTADLSKYYAVIEKEL
jgi:hypothetical protein